MACARFDRDWQEGETKEDATIAIRACKRILWQNRFPTNDLRRDILSHMVACYSDPDKPFDFASNQTIWSHISDHKLVLDNGSLDMSKHGCANEDKNPLLFEAGVQDWRAFFGHVVPTRGLIRLLSVVIGKNVTVSVGAGSALLEAMLQKQGCRNVVPLDICRYIVSYARVLPCDASQVGHFYSATPILMMVWPDGSGMDLDALQTFRGHTLILIVPRHRFHPVKGLRSTSCDVMSVQGTQFVHNHFDLMLELDLPDNPTKRYNPHLFVFCRKLPTQDSS